MKRFLIYFFLLAALAFSGDLTAQLSEEQVRQIDSLFIYWNRPDHPGGAVGIMKEGRVVYSKAFGLASLEYLVPNTPGTRFNIASVSKQFTSMGIVLLHLRGELNIDDDIRKHLPEVPDFGDPITIRHLMHHTSGLRSLHALLGLAGWRGDDSRTNEDLLRLMQQQKDLNFAPGEEYLYCNTGYMFMADIIERVTGEEFPAWMEAQVFTPLGMVHTYVENDYTRVVPSNATSYYGSYDSEFSRAVEYWGYVGSGNIHSNTSDLMKWLAFYEEAPEGWEDAFALMQTRGVLNSGDTLNYAFGIVLDEYKSHKRLQHGGSIGGYRSLVQAFPDQQLNLVLLTNFSSSDVGSRMNRMTDLMLGLDAEVTEGDFFTESRVNSIELPVSEMKKYTGFYWSEEANHSRRIYLKDDTLRYYRSASSESKLVPIGRDSFQMIDVPARVLVGFDLPENQAKQMVVRVGDNKPGLLEAYHPPLLTKPFLQSYTGRYFSPELDTYYTFSVQGDSMLLGNHTRHGDFEIKVLREDILEADGPLQSIRVDRDKRGRITGIYVSNGRVRNLWLVKQ